MPRLGRFTRVNRPSSRNRAAEQEAWGSPPGPAESGYISESEDDGGGDEYETEAE